MRRTRFQRTDDDEEISEPLLRPLFNDLIDCDDLLDRKDTPFARRTYVRCSLAFIEGHLYWLKETVRCWLIAHASYLRDVDVNRLVVLQDDLPKPGNTGKLTLEPSRLPFLPYCACIMRTAAECVGVDADAFFSDNRWNEVRKAIGIRHRITHPKNASDLEIADNEMETIGEAHRWIYNCMVDITNKINETRVAGGGKADISDIGELDTR